MFRTLRGRLILSHVLLILVLLPLMGLALIYLLEARVLFPRLSVQYEEEARLAAKLSASNYALWTEPEQAQALVDDLAHELSGGVMLFDAQGRLLASAGVEAAPQEAADPPELQQALQGSPSVHIEYTPQFHREAADVYAPIRGGGTGVLGVLRVVHPLSSVVNEFLRLRYVVAGVLGVALIVGALVGLVLGSSLNQPIRNLRLAVLRLGDGPGPERIEVQGPLEIRSLAEGFNRFIDRLQELETMRRQLLANLIHELGRPLGALLSAVQAMRGGAAQDPALSRELLDGMESELHSLKRLVGDLTGLQEQLLGSWQLAPQPIPLGAWLPRVVEPWRKAAESKGVALRVELPPGLPVVTFDPDRITQALGNLIGNAIQFTPEQGEISVLAGSVDGEAWMCVCDNGPGIPPDERARVFEPFFRGRHSGRFPEGMGLGLSIARDLVLSHGGRIELADGANRRGTCITLWLPLQPSP